MSAAERLAGAAGGFCQRCRGHTAMALPMVGGNERLMERPGGANLSAIARGCWAGGSYSKEHSFAKAVEQGECEKLVALKATATHW